MPGFDAGDSDFTPESSGPTSAPEVAWEVDATDPGNLVVADRTLVFTTRRAVVALDALTGAEGWRDESPVQDGFSGPAVADGTVYASNELGLRAFDLADGSERWSYTDPRAFYGNLLVADPGSPQTDSGTGRTLYATRGHALYAFTLGGDVRWTADVSPWRWGDVAVGPDHVVGVYEESGSRTLVAGHSRADGTQAWETENLNHGRATTLRRGRVFTGGYNGAIQAVDAETGEELWLGKGPETGSVGWLSADDERVYVTMTNQSAPGDAPSVLALDADAGGVVWTYPNGRVEAIGDEAVYVDTAGGLRALAAADGSERWSLDRRVVDVAVVDDALFGRTPDETVVALTT